VTARQSSWTCRADRADPGSPRRRSAPSPRAWAFPNAVRSNRAFGESPRDVRAAVWRAIDTAPPTASAWTAAGRSPRGAGPRWRAGHPRGRSWCSLRRPSGGVEPCRTAAWPIRRAAHCAPARRPFHGADARLRRPDTMPPAASPAGTPLAASRNVW